MKTVMAFLGIGLGTFVRYPYCNLNAKDHDRGVEDFSQPKVPSSRVLWKYSRTGRSNDGAGYRSRA